MNAILRERYEAPVLTNEGIEIHLTYLRSGFDAMQTALPVLRDKLDRLSEKVDSKIESLSAKVDSEIKSLSAKVDSEIKSLSKKVDSEIRSLSDKIDKANEQRAAGDAALAEKIDKANEQRAAGDAALGAKIDKLTEIVLKNQGQLNAVVWLISVASVLASLVSIARTLDWI